MVAAAKIPVCRGFTMPFYPMRPIHGCSITKPEDLASLDPKYYWTLKLNGDRACLAVVNGNLHVQNRHGAWFKQSADFAQFRQLTGIWLLDGEVYKRSFYPFEVVVEDGKNLADECPSVRGAKAKELCRSLDVPWMYHPQLNGQLSLAAIYDAISRKVDTPIEGVVGKRLGSAYVPMGSATSETYNYVKRKWI